MPHGARADARCIPWRFVVGCPVGVRCHFGLSAMPDAQRERFKGLSVMAIEIPILQAWNCHRALLSRSGAVGSVSGVYSRCDASFLLPRGRSLWSFGKWRSVRGGSTRNSLASRRPTFPPPRSLRVVGSWRQGSLQKMGPCLLAIGSRHACEADQSRFGFHGCGQSTFDAVVKGNGCLL